MLKGPDDEVTGQAVMENRDPEPGCLDVDLSCSTQPAVCCGAAASSSALVFPSVKWGQEEFLLPQGCVYLCVCAHTLSCVRIFVTSQTAAWDARDPLSRGFPMQEYWSGLPFPPPGDLPDPEMEPESPRSTCIGRQILYHCATWGGAVVRIKQVLQHSEN